MSDNPRHFREAKECVYLCGRQFLWAPSKASHEKSCARTQQMVTAMQKTSGLREQILALLDEKRMPLVAQLAEIDGMIRSLRSHVP